MYRSSASVRFATPVLMLLLVGFHSPAFGIYWNNDPAFGVASSTGLTDRTGWFQNTHVINNGSNGTRGTTTLLNPEWAITVRHVVQNGSNYSQIAAPNDISVNVLGTTYVADQIFTPDGVSEMALVHLRGVVANALDVTGQINSSLDETGRFVEVGGYGYYGVINTTNVGGTVPGTLNTGANFHRAYNVPWVPGQIQIIADGESSLASNGLLEGIAGPGDSGGPMFGYYGTGSPLSGSLTDWRLIGLTATSSATNGASWNNVSNYTRVANYASWINTTLNSLPGPGPSTTEPWVLNSGTNLYDSGGDKFSMTGSSSAPVAHAAFGPSGLGYTLDSVGDTISFSAIVDTPLSMGNIQFRFGMYDDAGGTIPGNVAGGTPWNGYFIGNPVEGTLQGAFEKGSHGGGVGQWWSLVNPNTAVAIGTHTAATGTFDDAGGNQIMPAGRYSLSLDYTRAASGLEIEWSMVSVDAAGVPNGVYSHAGGATDTSPASDTWTYNQLGLFLFGGGFSGTIIVDDINVSFTDVPEYAADFDGDGDVDTQDLAKWELDYGLNGDSDADGDGDSDGDDFLVWQREFGSGLPLLAGHSVVPEPSTLAMIMLIAGLNTSRSFTRRGLTAGKPGRNPPRIALETSSL